MLFNNDNVVVDYDKLPKFPVVSGELDCQFEVEQVFGYFVYHRKSDEVVPKTSRVEGMLQLNELLDTLFADGHVVIKITRKFFWDLDGEVREWIIAAPKSSLSYDYATEVDELELNTECNRSRIFKFELDYLYSLNAEYAPTRYGGKRLSDEAKSAKEEIGNQIIQSELDGWIQSIYATSCGTPCLSFELVSEFGHQFNRRDLSNMIKIPEDGICENVLEINDARNYYVSNRKLYTDEYGDGQSENMYLKVSLIHYWL